MKINWTLGLLLSLPCALWISPATAQDTATLKLKIVVEGTLPAPAPIANVADAYCAENKPTSDKVIASGSGDLANFALIFDEEKSKLKVPANLAQAEKVTHELDNNKCLFNPKVLVVRPGQTILVKNSDQTGHNANFKMFKNKPANFLVPPGKTMEYQFAEGLVEPSAMPITCDVHPWMTAFVIVKPHPYVGVSSDDGVIEIKDLPVGSGAIFRLWHESIGAISEINVAGKAVKLTRGNRWEMDLKPGVNDLGVVKIDAKLIKP